MIPSETQRRLNLTVALDAMRELSRRGMDTRYFPKDLYGVCQSVERAANAVAQDLEAAQKRVAELEAAQAWQPIDTAPKDGTRVLVAWDHAPTLFSVAWCFAGKWRRTANLCDFPINPTHWKPLIPPPADPMETPPL